MILKSYLKALEDAKTFLSVYENWSPKGSFSPRKCAYIAAADAMDAMEIPFMTMFTTGNQHRLLCPTLYLTEASKELYSSDVINLNDGYCPASEGKSDRERYEMVMAAYDRAIENVKKEIQEREAAGNGN